MRKLNLSFGLLLAILSLVCVPSAFAQAAPDVSFTVVTKRDGRDLPVPGIYIETFTLTNQPVPIPGQPVDENVHKGNVISMRYRRTNASGRADFAKLPPEYRHVGSPIDIDADGKTDTIRFPVYPQAYTASQNKILMNINGAPVTEDLTYCLGGYSYTYKKVYSPGDVLDESDRDASCRLLNRMNFLCYSSPFYARAVPRVDMRGRYVFRSSSAPANGATIPIPPCNGRPYDVYFGEGNGFVACTMPDPMGRGFEVVRWGHGNTLASVGFTVEFIPDAVTPSPRPTATSTPTPTPTNTPTPTPRPTNTPTPTPTATPTPTLTPTPTNTPTPTPTPTPKPIKSSRFTDEESLNRQAGGGTLRVYCAETAVCRSATAPDGAPCARQSASNSGNEHIKRVRISGISNIFGRILREDPKELWILECFRGVFAGNSYTCTTGSDRTDRILMGQAHANYSRLQSVLGLESRLEQIAGGSAAAITPGPLRQGKAAAAYELETRLTRAADSLVVIAHKTTAPPGVLTGSEGGQQMGTLSFGSECRIVHDPFGRVYDSHTLEPLSGARVTLLKKEAKEYVALQETANIQGIPSGFTNPQLTAGDGMFAFDVPDGTYRLRAVRTGYSIDSSPIRSSPYHGMAYSGGDIVQQGEAVEVDIPMTPHSKRDAERFAMQNRVQLINGRATCLSSSTCASGEVQIHAYVTHPRSRITLRVESRDNKLLKRQSVYADERGRVSYLIPVENCMLTKKVRVIMEKTYPYLPAPSSEAVLEIE